MFFRRRKAPEPRTGAWEALAERLELERLSDAEADALRAELGADTGRLASVHALRREGLPEVLLFEHGKVRQGARGPEEMRPRVLLRSEEPVSDLSWRAFPRSHPLLASLQASRSGGELVQTGDPDFDDRVGVITRDSEPVEGHLTLRVREALVRLLTGEGVPDATVTCGQNHLAWRAHREMKEPLDVLEAVAGRLLVLWVYLGASEDRFERDRAS